MAQVNIRVDDDLKSSVDILFSELGLNMSAAVNMFFRQAVRQGGIPFEVTTKVDPFWSATNQEHLRKAVADIEAGRVTAHELIEAD